MKINVLLADVGTSDSSGKLNLLGAGWSQMSVLPNGMTSDFAVAVFLEVPWDKCNRELKLVLELQTQDGQVVSLPTPAGPSAVRVKQGVVVPTLPGAPNGSWGSACYLVNFKGGLPLSPGNWYRWVVTADGEGEPGSITRFFVKRQPTMATFGGVSPPLSDNG